MSEYSRLSDDQSSGVIVAAQSGPLTGEVTVPGAKNSVLKLMAAALLADGVYELSHVPRIGDVDIMAELLTQLGLRIEKIAIPNPEQDGQKLHIVNSGNIATVAPFEIADRIRASVNVVGPLLGRLGEVDIALPGGDDFGGRPIDIHLRGLEAMGATFTFSDDGLIGRANGLYGADISLEFPSVGATENLLMAAVCAAGTTTIANAAREPEIGDLCLMLRSMGAHIEGIGTQQLVIHGVAQTSLQSTTHTTVADRVQAATYMSAVAMCGGDVHVKGAIINHMEMLMSRFTDMGMTIAPTDDGINVRSSGRLSAVDISTLPYPGIATDYKPLLVTMLGVSDGTAVVTENLYPGRFRYIEELRKFGADITIDGHHAVVRGVEHLTGAVVHAPDIRAGAALVVAGLAASGMTEIRDIHHIDRGYDDLVGRLAALGAAVSRVD